MLKIPRFDWGNPQSKGSYLCRKKQRSTTRKPPNIMSTRPVITGKLPSIMKAAITRRPAHHAHVAHGHHAHATHHATEAAKAHAEAHGAK